MPIVTAIDLSRMPIGEIGWQALVDHVTGSDDRVERYFLEVKSDVDLNSKQGRAKIAKFILGAANRDPATAARRFGGHALMMLGVGNGSAPGIPGFEAKDLARDVQRLIGADGPRWDFERIAGDDGTNDIIVIVVDPPTGDVWTARADGDGLTNGGIYVRGDGDTRQATGDEIRLMIARASSKPAAVDVDVAVNGKVRAVEVDEDILTAWVDREADRYRNAAAAKKPGPYSDLIASSAFTIEQRSREEFVAEVDAWQQEALAAPAAGVIRLAARVYHGIRVAITNNARTFMRDVRVDLDFDGAVRAVPWLDRDEDQPVDLFPDKPIPWGQKTISSLIDVGMHRVPPAFPSVNNDGVLHVVKSLPAHISVVMSSLRPEEVRATDDDEVVLVLLTADPPKAVRGRWRVTAQDINDIFEGEFEIAVEATDWREAIDTLLNGSNRANGDED